MIIDRLFSGGIITNYYCTSKCAHCLYACAPSRERKFMDEETARRAMLKIRSMGCYSFHIGGGEPMLDLEGLTAVARVAKETGMSVEYVETNSSWYRDEDRAVQILAKLMETGIRQLLVSISPFHNAHIPFYKVKGVLQACRKSGMQVFPWIMNFYADIDAFDDRRTHTMEEYRERYGQDYQAGIPLRYWTHLGGRAVQAYKEIFPLKSLESILESPACHELTDTSHFHIDLYGNYIPGLCSGLTIRMEDLGLQLGENEYPLITMLFEQGISAFLEYAKREYGFIPDEKYLNKCHLCNDIRYFLYAGKYVRSIEMQPEGYYQDN